MITSGVRVTCSRQRSQVQSAQAWQLKYFALKIEDMSEWIEALLGLNTIVTIKTHACKYKLFNTMSFFALSLYNCSRLTWSVLNSKVKCIEKITVPSLSQGSVNISTDGSMVLIASHRLHLSPGSVHFSSANKSRAFKRLSQRWHNRWSSKTISCLTWQLSSRRSWSSRCCFGFFPMFLYSVKSKRRFRFA